MLVERRRPDLNRETLAGNGFRDRRLFLRTGNQPKLGFKRVPDWATPA